MFTHLSPPRPVPSQEPGVRGHLQNLLSMTPGGYPVQQGYTYRSIHDFVLDRGKVYKSASLTTDERRVVRAAMGQRRFAKKACFYNAHMLVMGDMSDTLVYTEGFAFSRFMPMHHGWVTVNGKVVDVTWDMAGNPVMGALPEGWEYVGVEFPDRNMLRERITRRKEVHAVIDDPQDGFPVLKWDRLTPP